MTFSRILMGGGGGGKAHLNWLSCCKPKVNQKKDSEFEAADKHDVVSLE